MIKQFGEINSATSRIEPSLAVNPNITLVAQFDNAAVSSESNKSRAMRRCSEYGYYQVIYKKVRLTSQLHLFN